METEHHEYCTGGYDPDDVVISGIAGRFPNSDNVGELKENLFNKKDLVIFSDARYTKGAMKVPYDSCGLVNGLDKFDAEFFCCGYSIAHGMDPATRIHLTLAYEAVADAGYDATDMKGANIGVYNATTHDDAQKLRTARSIFHINCFRTMTANRVSYTFDWTGPSYSADAACASSSIAFWNAVKDIRTGVVEAALVTGCQLNLHPDYHLGYIKAGIVSNTGRCRPFNADTDGMMRTEAITAVFLQKAKVARRAYAKVCAVNFFSAGYVPEGISVPSYKMQRHMMEKTLRESDVDIDDIDYVEAHGTGTPVGDPIELNALADTFCQSRDRPLYVGTIKSNIGHTEASSGLCGVIKTIIAFEEGRIPPNIKFDNPNPGCPALVDKRLVVVTDPIPCLKDHIPVTTLGFGGTLVQILLKKNPTTYGERSKTSSPLPRLVLYPATTEEAIKTVFDYVRGHPDLPNEFFALLYQLSYTQPLLKPFRGFALYQDKKSPVTQTKIVPPQKRPVWFVMTGMGCQWSGMGLQLMQLDVFAESMRRSAAVLLPYGIDLFEILRADRKHLEEHRNIISPFVGICAIQIALVDMLRHLGIRPDGMVGHSVGELMCAYADGCLTSEQTLLAAYFRGRSMEDANVHVGGMAAVGISWAQAHKLCPEGVYPACDNADDSVTVSGREEPLQRFVKKLEEDKVFVRLVNSQGFPFHCQLVHNAVPILRKAMNKIVPEPKARTSRWVSSSYPESEWGQTDCKVAGGEYFVHNLMSSVLFRGALAKIPRDAIVIEIGPHFLLQSILKRAVGPGASFFGLMRRNEANNIQFLMDSLGRLYNEGLDPKIERLYPPVKFPVPRGTPVLSDLIRWNHTMSFDVPKYSNESSEFSRKFDLDKEDSYLLDHVIDGRALFPATGYVCLAWEALADKIHKDFREMPVVVENFKIHRAVIITAQSPVTFHVNILDSTGRFEITEGKSIVASGEVTERKNLTFEEKEDPSPSRNESPAVSGKEVYAELRMSGYEYGPNFQGLAEMNTDGTSGRVWWQEKWIPFLDSLLLFFGLVTDRNGLCLPTGARSFRIDPRALKRAFARNNSHQRSEGSKPSQSVPVSYNSSTKICRSTGIEISHLHTDPAPRKGTNESPILEEYRFVPNSSSYVPGESSTRPILQYFHACNVAMNEIGKTSGTDCEKYRFVVDAPKLDDGEDLKGKDRCLLKALDAIACDASITSCKRREVLSSYVQCLGEDILNHVLVNEESLRLVLETITENSYRKLAIAEISRNFPTVVKSLSEILQKYFYMKFRKITLVEEQPNPQMTPDVGVLKDHNIQLFDKNHLKVLANEKDLDVAVSSFGGGSTAELKDLLQTLSSIVKPNGFIMFFLKDQTNPAEEFLSSLCHGKIEVQSQKIFEALLRDMNLLIMNRVSDTFGGVLFLLRAPSAVDIDNKVLSVTDSNYSWVDDLKKELYSSKNSGTVWLLAQGSPFSGVVGMVNCLKQEPGGERIRCVFISENSSNLPAFDVKHSFYKQLLAKNLVMNVWKDGAWGSFRHVLMKEAKQVRKVEHSYVHCRKYGDLSSFEWVESNVKYVESKTKNLVHIYYSALNFKDVMLATGKISSGTAKMGSEDPPDGMDSILGFEFCGREPNGRRVCGLASSCGMATAALVDPAFYFQVPDHWSLEDAATVPVVYSTCYYALIMRAGLRRGESVLIHSGTGGIGTAAIHIATSLECEIFTTVGNEEKRRYLRKKFPHIKEENIGCSRDTSFKSMVLKRTNGKGVDVVLNSLADDKFQASLQCVAKNGRFVEIGKYDLSLDRQIGLKMFLENISFHAVFLDQLFGSDSKTLSTLQETFQLMQEGIKRGVVRPLERTVFEQNAVEEAFRYMAKGVHVGKVLLKIRNEEPDKVAVPRTLRSSALPNTYFYPDKVYVVVGGLGGFGIELTKWMIGRGARNILLTSRYGARTPYHHMCLNKWERGGARVRVSTLNVAVRSEAEKLLREAAKTGPVGGIINSAVVLKDAFLDCQTSGDFREVCAPKADATLHLDSLSRTLCPDLDLFVCFSSISCGRGNAGQSNYGLANSVMERVCEERRKDGLHGLAIQWGIIGEVGVFHRHVGDDGMIAGVKAQSVRSCLDSFDVFCQQDSPVVSSYVLATASKKSVQADALTQIAKIMGMDDASQLSTTRNFGEMGIDSMVGVELKQLVESYSSVSISIPEIQEMKVDDLKALIQSSDIDTSTSRAPPLFSTAVARLPARWLHPDPVVVLNKTTVADREPYFVVSFGDEDVTNFSALADVLETSVYALVRTKDTPVSSVEATASWYLKIIRNITGGPFHLIGHRLGGNVAFEIGLQCQNSNAKLRTFHLMSGSADLASSLSKDGSENDDLEVVALSRFVEQFVDDGSSRLEEELLNLSGTDQRVNAVLNRLIQSSSNRDVDKKELTQAARNYLEIFPTVWSYLPSAKLRMDLGVIEDPTKVLANDVTALKASFAQVCSGKITIHRSFSFDQLPQKEMAEGLAAILQRTS